MKRLSCDLCDADRVEFHFTQDFDAAPDEIIAAFINAEFWEGIDGLTATSAPSVLSIEPHGHRVTVRLRYRLIVDLPSEAARFIDTSSVSWVEVSEWDTITGHSVTEFLPDQAARLLIASATTRLESRDSGTRRQIRGDVRVRIPLLGSKVERALISGVGDHLAEQVGAVNAYLS